MELYCASQVPMVLLFAVARVKGRVEHDVGGVKIVVNGSSVNVATEVTTTVIAAELSGDDAGAGAEDAAAGLGVEEGDSEDATTDDARSVGVGDEDATSSDDSAIESATDDDAAFEARGD